MKYNHTLNDSTILGFPLAPDSRVRFLILGSGNPRNRDLYLTLGSGNPETRYRLKRKTGLFERLGAQKILKCYTKLYSEGIFFLGPFVDELLRLG